MSIEGRKEGNVLFNDALNTFYLWLYSIRHMVKNHSDSERGNQKPFGPWENALTTERVGRTFLLNVLSTYFILRLVGMWYMVKDHSYSGLLFPISSKRSFTSTTGFLTPVGKHWLYWASTMKTQSDNIMMDALPQSDISLPCLLWNE